MERIGAGAGRELVRSWGSEIDDGTLRQALTSARGAAVCGPVALMADAHVGIGATVGSVIPTEGAIIPAAVGVDLGCGMIAERINCHHNYAANETHDGRSLWITRKGAIRARVGDRGVIPGSMGTDSYVVTGLGNPDSYTSAAHGAGRRMSRTRAKRDVSIDDFRDAMAGRTWQHGRAERLLDESPMAYKDIATVMADQADLVRVDHVLRAIMNYKGC